MQPSFQKAYIEIKGACKIHSKDHLEELCHNCAIACPLLGFGQECPLTFLCPSVQ